MRAPSAPSTVREQDVTIRALQQEKDGAVYKLRGQAEIHYGEVGTRLRCQFQRARAVCGPDRFPTPRRKGTAQPVAKDIVVVHHEGSFRMFRPTQHNGSSKVASVPA